MVGGELAVRSIVVLPDWRVEEKLYMSLVPSCLGNGVVREGEVAGDCLDRLLVGEAVCCLCLAASTEGRVCCFCGLFGEASRCCCCARLRFRLSGEVGVSCLTLDGRDIDGM